MDFFYVLWCIDWGWNSSLSRENIALRVSFFFFFLRWWKYILFYQFYSIIRSLLVRCRFFNARIGKDERDEGMKRGSINNNKINLPDELVEINFIEIGIYQLSTDCIFLIFRMESSHPCPPPANIPSTRDFSSRTDCRTLFTRFPLPFHSIARFYPRENFTNHREQYPFANKSRKIKARPPPPRIPRYNTRWIHGSSPRKSTTNRVIDNRRRDDAFA